MAQPYTPTGNPIYVNDTSVPFSPHTNRRNDFARGMAAGVVADEFIRHETNHSSIFDVFGGSNQDNCNSFGGGDFGVSDYGGGGGDSSGGFS